MEKNIVDHFKIVLANKNGHLSMNSFRGHLADLSQRERKYIKKFGLDKLVNKYPNFFLLCDEDIHLIKEEEKSETESSTDGEVEEDDKPKTTEKTVTLQNSEDDPCTVCSDPIEIFAIGDCQHPICFRCSTKLRVLCEDKNCPVCRQKLELVVFSKKLLKLDQHDVKNYIQDKKYGIVFENAKVCEQKITLLRHICTNCPQPVIFDSFDKLEDHAKAKHQLFYCQICVRQCKIFTHERKTYSKSELKKHQEKGDEAGSAREGHPLCGFCETRYLDNDELHRHLRLHHCSCFICDELNEGRKNFQFYLDLPDLHDHYQENHFTCEDEECCSESGFTAVFKNEIELQSHTLQKHGGKKTKQEKKQEQIINLPNMFGIDKASMPPQKVLTVVQDPAGGIQCTGHVVSKIEKLYSFIVRDDAPDQWEENVFFDLDACGLQYDDDLRDYFEGYERVSVYAIPAARNCKSKWKAQRVEKCYDGDSSIISIPDNDSIKYSPTTFSNPEKEELESDDAFPALQNRFMPNNSSLTPALGGWSTKVAKERPKLPVRSMSLSNYTKKESTATVTKPDYEIGYIHQHIADKFGFITNSNNEFTDNVYFNLDNYRSGMNLIGFIGDLRNILEIGEKVCYTLQPDGPKHQGVKSKYRADKVWKFNYKPLDLTQPGPTVTRNRGASLELPTFATVVPTRPKTKVKASDIPGQKGDVKNGQFNHDELVKKFKMKLMIQDEIRGAALSQGSESSVESHGLGALTPKEIKNFHESGYSDVSEEEAVYVVTDKLDERYDQTRKKENIAGMKGNGDPTNGVTTLMGSSIVPTRTINAEVFSMNEKRSFPDPSFGHTNGSLLSSSLLSPRMKQVQLQKASNKNDENNESSDDEEGSSSEYDSSSSEMYSSEEEDWECEGNWCQCQKFDLYYIKYMETIEACLKNKGLTKLLRKRIAEEMQKKKSMQACNLQFLEFRKEDNSAHLMFYITSTLAHSAIGDNASAVNIPSSQYVKLDGYYPLEKSWYSELKDQKIVTKVSKDMYHISNTCHYITVTRNKHDKVAKVMLHYRPLPGKHGKTAL